MVLRDLQYEVEVSAGAEGAVSAADEDRPFSSSSPISRHTAASSPCISDPTAFSLPGVRSVSRSTWGEGRSRSRLGNAAYRCSIARTLDRLP